MQDFATCWAVENGLMKPRIIRSDLQENTLHGAGGNIFGDIPKSNRVADTELVVRIRRANIAVYQLRKLGIFQKGAEC